jgi:hypothetical protein
MNVHMYNFLHSTFTSSKIRTFSSAPFCQDTRSLRYVGVRSTKFDTHTLAEIHVWPTVSFEQAVYFISFQNVLDV